MLSRWNKQGGKQEGISAILDHYKIKVEETMAFGDGHNDISMMRQAPISIAMGNAIDEVKEVATYITKSNQEDGIEYACKHFGWID